MDLEVVIHLRGKIRIMRRIKSLSFFLVHHIKVIF